MTKKSPQSLPIPTNKVPALLEALKTAGYIETLASKDESQKVTFREFRSHNYLTNTQASLNRRDPDLKSAPVVSIYLGKSPKVVASPAAAEDLKNIMDELTPGIS